jgi:hypothetical protein
MQKQKKDKELIMKSLKGIKMILQEMAKSD